MLPPLRKWSEVGAGWLLDALKRIKSSQNHISFHYPEMAAININNLVYFIPMFFLYMFVMCISPSLGSHYLCIFFSYKNFLV